MKTKHTHEIRKNMKSLERKTKTVFQGDEKQCDDYLKKIANARGVGVPLITGNGNYDLVCLKDEADAKIRRAAPELLNALLFMSYQLQESTTVIMITAIQMATGMNFYEQKKLREEMKKNGYRETISKASCEGC